MTDADDNETRYELVMPFVLTQSNGGPYEDKAFTAGWQLGELSVKLQVTAAIGETLDGVYMDRALQPQIDLLAMKHGLVAMTTPLELEDDPDGSFWGYSFAPVTEDF